MKQIIIIGNGISGITAARNIRKKLKHHITIISAESDHFFSRTALMYIYMGHMRYSDTKPYEDFFWEKNDINLLNGFVTSVDTESKQLSLSDGKTLKYDTLIIAAGSKPNMFGWPGQDLQGVQGLYSKQDLELMGKNTEDIDNAVITGGGLIGVEMAEMLLSRNISVTFLVREKHYWSNVLPYEESNLIRRHIEEHHVDLRLETELKEILSDDYGKARAIITGNNEQINCQFVGLTTGVSPNIDFLKSSHIETDKGVLINEYFETNIPNVYSIGDCAQFRNPLKGRKPIEQVWYTGRLHGKTVADTICGTRAKYTPGIWFNSAKFFDIEYQTYGNIPPELNDDEKTLYWEHTGGKKCLRINYRKDNDKITGFNVLGFRLRHEVCDNWLKTGKTIYEALHNLNAINFDPEFSKNHNGEILQQFKSLHD